MHQHGTTRNPLSRSIVANNLLRWQPSVTMPEDQEPETIEQKRERQRLNNLHRFWYAGYERAEWWRQFRCGMTYTAQLLVTVFAVAMILGAIKHGVR